MGEAARGVPRNPAWGDAAHPDASRPDSGGLRFRNIQANSSRGGPSPRAKNLPANPASRVCVRYAQCARVHITRRRSPSQSEMSSPRATVARNAVCDSGPARHVRYYMKVVMVAVVAVELSQVQSPTESNILQKQKHGSEKCLSYNHPGHDHPHAVPKQAGAAQKRGTFPEPRVRRAATPGGRRPERRRSGTADAGPKPLRSQSYVSDITTNTPCLDGSTNSNVCTLQLRPIHELRIRISQGLTLADSRTIRDGTS